MGHVIGKGGSTIRRIRTETGASIYTTDEGFSIKGTPEQRAEAKQRIDQVLVSAMLTVRFAVLFTGSFQIGNLFQERGISS